MIVMSKEEKMRYKALIILTVIAVITLLVVPGAFAETHGFTQSEIAHAKSVHARNAEDLLRLPGVQGVGIGEHLGRLGILILVDDESRLPHIPGAIEDMSAVTPVVGEITAHAINLGVSGGNSLICGGYCAGGTVGFKVCDNTTVGVDGIITNNHVAAAGCPNLCPNNAPLGTNFFSPGVIDDNPVCTTTGATAVGALKRFVPIVLDGVTTNYVDAAFVQSADTLVSNNIQGLGAQNNTVVAAYLGQTVCKSGRTSGVTCGTVTGVSLIVNVNYGQACGMGRFSNMIMYSPVAPYTVMSQAGDSGSPVVDANTNAAVALNFAGTQSGIGIGNPMGAVLSALKVSLCGSVSGSSVSITVTTSPSGKQINVDGTTYTAPHTFSWVAGSSHALGVASPQSGSTGTQYVFSSWSDGGSQTHTITAPSATATYTAQFTTQYQLTTPVNPAGAGSVTPDCSAGCWFNSGASSSLSAVANAGYTFSSWSGAISSTGNPTALTINAPKTVTANFRGATFSISGSVKTSTGTTAPGVTMTLGGAKTATTTTSTTGAYTFAGLANGSYTVTPRKTGYTFAPTSQSVTISGANVINQNFTATTGSGTTYSISGSLKTSAGIAISGVTMTLSGAKSATTTTDINGQYSFTGLANGTYMVKVGKSGYYFLPSSKTATISGADVTLNFNSYYP